MKGRRVLREPQCQSLCDLCSHRFVNVRRPTTAQRRFLQSSRSVSNPGAQAAAFKQEIDDDDPSPTPTPRPGGWGKPAFGNAPTSDFGRPKFGAATTLSSESTTVELTPEEQQLRDRLRKNAEEEQKRTVNIPSGPGPEATRGGRPIPYGYETRYSESQPQRGSRSLSQDRPQSQRVRYDNRRREPQSQLQSKPQLPNREIEQAFREKRNIPPNPNNARTDFNAQSSNWGQLPRRSVQSSQGVRGTQSDTFGRDRAEREAQTSSGRYVSLGNRSIFNRDTQTDAPLARNPQPPTNSLRGWGSEGALRSRNPINTKFDWRGGNIDNVQQTEGSSTLREPYNRTPINREPFNSGGGYLSQKPQASGMQSGWRTPVQSEPSEPKRDVEDRASRSRGRFTAPTQEVPAKGKNKDKSRRRDQFVNEDEEDDFDFEVKRRAELKKQRKAEKAAKKAAIPTPIILPEYISVSNLASALKVRMEEFMKKMEELGFEEMSGDHILNAENAGLIAQEYNFEPLIDTGESEDIKARPAAEDPSVLPQRPPVVTIMGHVDHGKTTLLDYLRKSSVAATEHGGITQHIGAFSVPMPSGKVITFLDTPGHAAFLSMRQRGANVTDIVILVVAADDSVKPQTIEAINHAKAAKVPVIVALNKIDKEGANIERAKQDLARHGVEIEDFGGDTQVVCVSGKTGQGMEELEEAAVTLSEILDMRAERDGQAEGWVIEASLKPSGKVATVLVRRGTMRPGDFFVAGKTWARIRCLRNEAGIEIAEAGPGTPVEIDGWRDLPLAGDEVLQAEDESKAKRAVEYRVEKEQREKLASDMDAINESRKAEQEKREREKREAAVTARDEAVSDKVEEIPEQDGTKRVYFIVKGDVSGSVEAVVDSISALGNNEVQSHVLRSGVGQLTEFDVQHAADAGGHLINFNTTVDSNIQGLAARAKVAILDHDVIYRLVDEVREKLSDKLPPIITQKVTGEAQIAQIFEITVKGRKVKAVAGCKVKNGVVARNSKVKVLRDGEKVYDGPLSSLKNVKKDVQEMKKGTECGLAFEEWADFIVGDQIQCYEEISEKRHL